MSNPLDQLLPGEEEMLRPAAEVLLREDFKSTSTLQRQLKWGYMRANRIMAQLEKMGIVDIKADEYQVRMLVPDMNTVDEILSHYSRMNKLEEIAERNKTWKFHPQENLLNAAKEGYSLGKSEGALEVLRELKKEIEALVQINRVESHKAQDVDDEMREGIYTGMVSAYRTAFSLIESRINNLTEK
jgi:hypothetical protein